MKVRVLITVKTYPVLSAKYDELVCTAGITDDGKWIRIYPIPFRKLDYDKMYSKYQWIELEVEKNPTDIRPESYKPKDFYKAKLEQKISTEKDPTWEKRKDVVFKCPIFTNKARLLEEAKDRNRFTSLAIFKPTSIKKFHIKPVERSWDIRKLQKLEIQAQQLALFKDSENPFKVVEKLPYEFSYEFLDDEGKSSTLMIEDWEIGMLYWNCFKNHDGDEQKACEDVRKKYFDDFAKTKDLHLFLGTTYTNHIKNAPNPFVIIGTFHPQISQQIKLF